MNIDIRSNAEYEVVMSMSLELSRLGVAPESWGGQLLNDLIGAMERYEEEHLDGNKFSDLLK